MTQAERRLWLIQELKAERARYAGIAIPEDAQGQRDLLRALMNVRPPEPIGDELLAVQDAYLRERRREKGVVTLAELSPVGREGMDVDLYLWRGDITRLATDVIVNAANSQLLGCFVPGHHCIDNAIHTFAGVQLRLACNDLMEAQGHEEGTGLCKLTPAFNLPSRSVAHTVGPIVMGHVTPREQLLLRSSYRSCLEAAQEGGYGSIAFCCISTGVFRFPGDLAAELAADEVRRFKAETKRPIKVVFNVFLEKDEARYRRVLGL